MAASVLDYASDVKKIFFNKGALPTQLIYYVTNRCNAKCHHCFFWDELNVPMNELTLDEIRQITKTLDSLSFLIMTGGEPFMRKDIAELAKAFYDNCGVRNIVIPSNGILKNQTLEAVKKMSGYCPNAHLVVNISFDGLREQHDYNRGVPCFDKAWDTLKALKELKKTHPNLNVGTIITYTAFNQHNIKEVYEFIRDNMQPDSITMNFVRGKPKNPDTKNVNVENFEGVSREIEEDLLTGKLEGFNNFPLADVSRVTNILIREHVARTVRENRELMPCLAGTLSGVLYSNGDVFPCELLDRKIGNIRDFGFDFRKLWETERARKTRDFIKDTKCFCTHECFYYTNMLMNPLNLPKVAAKIAKLKVNRALHKLKQGAQ
ncbi:MAG: radical SAM protein [Candidatus Diapherotrites archaeon]|uniref:Radical SAM protein n=1 Tax=Candidatus Iainarchaeum sp. TaxID=3101447 RepID=A0A8T4LAC8_9ARCH|nr:radical SAM protein [Candidatus Diapherotrites archaeon]